MSEILRRLRVLLHRGRLDRELEEEMRSHLEMAAEETGDDNAARRAFGNPLLLREQSKATWGWRRIEELAQDARFALRTSSKNRGFTAVALITLALGIGANTAIFSLFNAVMLRALPVRDPERLIFFQHSSFGSDISAVGWLSSGYGESSLPYATYEAFRDHAQSLDGVFVFVSSGVEGNDLTVNVGGRAVTADGEMVTGSYFSVLGVSPIMGRAIVDEDLSAGSPNVAVISHGFWLREFNGDRSVIGRSITINGAPFAVVGIAPQGFVGLLGLHGAAPDLWVPLRPTDDMRPWGSRAASADTFFSDRRWWWCTIGARVKPGATRSEVLAETDHLFRQSITAGLSNIPANLPKLAFSAASPVFEGLRRRFNAPLRILMVTAALVLLIACVNLAALMLARAKSRQKEIGVRLAIGASRWRLMRQLLTESVLLSVCGGVLGMLIARWGGSALLRLILGGSHETPLNVSPDGTVLAFAAAVSVATGVLFGLAPALRATRMNLAPQLKEGASSTTPQHGLGRLLVATQIALSVVLLFGAGLFLRTFRNLDGQKLGFQRENLLLFEIDPGRSGYKDASGIALHSRLLERIQRLPGVRSATYSEHVLLSGWHSSSPSGTDGQPLPPGQPNQVYYNRVGPGFFETMGMRVLLVS